MKYIYIYKTVILSVAICEYETWSLVLKKECRLREFENRMLRKVSGSVREEVTGG